MLDLFIVILLAWAIFSGWRAGLLKELISTTGFVVGLFIAATFYSTLGSYLAVNGSETNMFTSIVAFLLLWIIVPIALGLAANLLTKALKGMKLGLPNSLLGASVSVAKFLLLLSCVFNAMTALGIMNEERTAESKLYRPVSAVVGAFFDEEPAAGGAMEASDDEEAGDTIWVDVSKKQ